MQRMTHRLTQGSNEWKLFRANHFGASEASAMLGLSPYKTRDQLLHEKATGLTKEVDATLQKVFDIGHKSEKLARPIVEKLIGVQLSPIVMSYGKMSASTDGLDFEVVVAWENKQFNKSHFEQVKNGKLPDIHWPQCQQILYVTGAEKLFFTISDGTEENTVGIWVYPDQDKQTVLLSGWNQFTEDLANYVPPVQVEKVAAETVESLPVPSVVVRGEITASNIDEITPKFDSYLESINTKLSTDQDFADAEANAKNCRDTAKRIESLQDNIIAQMVSVNEVNSILGKYKDAFNKIGLSLEKAVKEQKETIKTNAILKAKGEFLEFIGNIKCEISLNQYFVLPNFAEAIKGVKTIESMQSRINDALAQGKALATSIAKDINTKLAYVNDAIKGYEHLFNVNDFIIRDIDYIKLHITSVKEQEDKRKAEYEARIKAQAEADARSKVEAEQRAKAKADETSNQPIAEVAKDLNSQQLNQTDFKKVFNATEPTRQDIISLVAKSYNVQPQQAEKWIVNMFSE
jgi:putative phage-type endonuclease